MSFCGYLRQMLEKHLPINFYLPRFVAPLTVMIFNISESLFAVCDIKLKPILNSHGQLLPSRE